MTLDIIDHMDSSKLMAEIKVTCSKGPSQKYLEANEVKYFSLGGEGVGDFMVTISHFQKKLASGLVFTIIE